MSPNFGMNLYYSLIRMKITKIIRLVTNNRHYDKLLKQVNFDDQVMHNYIFTTEDVQECDYLIVLEFPKREIKAHCPQENVWIWSMEPPEEKWEWHRKAYKHFSKVITIDKRLNHPKIVHHQLAIPWNNSLSFENLNRMNWVDFKKKNISFITSNAVESKGHAKRLKFLKCLRNKLDFDLYGRGFRELQNKENGLLPYKYSIVIENSSYPDYWSEKLADAFLCGCYPFYFGCKNVYDYFEKDSLTWIDINNPKEAIKKIKETIDAKTWEERILTIDRMREKILNEYQFFPVLINLIKRFEGDDLKKQNIIIPKLGVVSYRINPYSLHRVFYRFKKLFLNKKYNNPDSPLFGFTNYH